jgi:hypothetical protein
MRRAELLVKQIQRATENERVGANDGISVEEYYQYLTDGQRFIQQAIISKGSRRFRTSTTWSADGAEARALPFDVLSPEAIVSLEYSSSGLERDYRRLERRSQLERWSDTGVPFQYILEGTELKINAYPATGSFRLTYQKRLPRLDKRRGTVGSRTKTTTAITALSISGYTDADYLLFDHLTIVSWAGAVNMRAIPYTAVALGVVTIQGSSYTFPSGSTCEVGDYVVLGEYATTHPLLPDDCESALILYGEKRILMRDASDDAIARDAEMERLLARLLEGYESEDIEEIPIVQSCDWSMD